MNFIVRNIVGFNKGSIYGQYHRYLGRESGFYFDGHGNYETYFGVRSRFCCIIISNNILKYFV